jgi:hypothetical protein
VRRAFCRVLQGAVRALTDSVAVTRRIVEQVLLLASAADGDAVELLSDGELACVCATGSRS